MSAVLSAIRCTISGGRCSIGYHASCHASRASDSPIGGHRCVWLLAGISNALIQPTHHGPRAVARGRSIPWCGLVTAWRTGGGASPRPILSAPVWWPISRPLESRPSSMWSRCGGLAAPRLPVRSNGRSRVATYTHTDANGAWGPTSVPMPLTNIWHESTHAQRPSCRASISRGEVRRGPPVVDGGGVWVDHLETHVVSMR
jgi:hypothetical protein